MWNLGQVGREGPTFYFFIFLASVILSLLVGLSESFLIFLVFSGFEWESSEFFNCELCLVLDLVIATSFYPLTSTGCAPIFSLLLSSLLKYFCA